MKLFRFFLLSIIVASLFSSCQKDTSFEAGVARGALSKDINGDCLFISPVGNFQKNVTFNGNSYIQVEVIFSEAGSYNIKTDTVNGYSFSDIGIGTVGLNVLRLKASGTPINVGIDEFKVKFDGSFCTTEVSVGNAPTTTVAAFSFVGAPGTCTGATVNAAAIFMQGIPTNSTNWVDINVNVTTAGTYAINTGATAINGVKYSGSGSLSLGNQVIRLIADGSSPTASGTFNYPITGNGSNCGFDVVYQSLVAAATYTISCGTVSTQGTYTVGTAMTSANKMTIPITGATAGSYNISVSSNGVTFANSGLLAAGATSIILFATGTGTASGPSLYTVSGGGGTACPVVINFAAAAGPGTGFIKANIDGAAAFTNFNTNIAAVYTNSTLSEIQFEGSTTTGEDFLLLINKPGAFATGISYDVTQILSGVQMGVNYAPDPMTIFEATSISVFLADPFKVKFTTLTPTRMAGTFSGTMQEDGLSGNPIKVFTNGSFDITF